MSRFLSERFQSLRAYVPGEQPRDMTYIKLNTNESPYPPAPQVIYALNREEAENLRLYSDPECLFLRETLAEYYGVRTENILVGNGSDEILSFIFMAYCDDKTGVLYPDISYGFYPVFANLYGLRKNEIPLREDFSIFAEDYLNTGSTVVIANPNAPTGICLSPEDIELIVKSNPDNVVVIDEAYIDFGGISVIPLTKKYDNLLVVQTYSKSRSLAGARLGYAIGNEALIADLDKLRNSTKSL
jgi:histidinol-phosphate aminotransferase